MKEEQIDELEAKAILALVRMASEGNAGAAASAMTAVQRIREKGSAKMHAEKMDSLSTDPVGMCAYLGLLGLSGTEVATRFGRKLKPEELKAWNQACDDRLLEVRAIELQRMRTNADVPRWATKKVK